MTIMDRTTGWIKTRWMYVAGVFIVLNTLALLFSYYVPSPADTSRTDREIEAIKEGVEEVRVIVNQDAIKTRQLIIKADQNKRALDCIRIALNIGNGEVDRKKFRECEKNAGGSTGLTDFLTQDTPSSDTSSNMGGGGGGGNSNGNGNGNGGGNENPSDVILCAVMVCVNGELPKLP